MPFKNHYGPSGISTPTPVARRVRHDKWIPALRVSVRHFLVDETEFSQGDGRTHYWTVPPGKYWYLMGGMVSRNGCNVTLTVDVVDEVAQRRRLVVLAAGTSDTTDIPDNIIRGNNILKPLAEGDQIRVLYGGDVRGAAAHAYARISIVEGQAK